MNRPRITLSSSHRGGTKQTDNNIDKRKEIDKKIMNAIVNVKKKNAVEEEYSYVNFDNLVDETDEEELELDDELDEDDEDDLKPGQKRKKARRKVKQTETLEVESRYLNLMPDGTCSISNEKKGTRSWMVGSNESLNNAKKRLGLQ